MDAQQGFDLDERREHRLYPVLLASFALAAGATLWPALGEHRPVTSSSSVAAVLAPAPVSASRRDGFVVMSVVDVIERDGDARGVVLLSDARSDVVLPLFVDADEAAKVREGLAFEGLGPSGSAAVFSGVIEALGGELARVEVDGTPGAEDSAARLVLRRGGEEIPLEASASEALVLALAAKAPVYTSESLLASRGIQREQVKRQPGALPSNLKDPQRL